MGLSHLHSWLIPVSPLASLLALAVSLVSEARQERPHVGIGPGDLGNQHSDCILKFLEAVYRLARPAVGNGLLAATLTKEATARLTSSEILGRNQALFALLSCQ